MRIPIYQVDAFTDRVFGGNPAAVCPLESWLPDETLQAIAAENNLSETAFVVAREDGAYDLRWFTPLLEVDLCGHATLASALVVFEHLRVGTEAVTFWTKSGALDVIRRGALLEMDFPSQPGEACDPPAGLVNAMGGSVAEVLRSVHYYLVAYGAESEVRSLTPDEAGLRSLDLLGVIATAPGDDVDFVSRFFAPKAGIYEDPVTGSAHCVSVPYWADRLGRTDLRARQISTRVGELSCTHRGARVAIAGNAVMYLEGEITLR
jgi:predicted PhzF superfamily epimerase YddE/YHI9